MKKPKFSIIIPYYQGLVSDEEFFKCIECLVNQSFKNFEVLIYHDGQLLRQLGVGTYFNMSKLKGNFYIYKKRFNDWGHSLRDIGIKEASGEYIIHLNADNIMYNCLQELNDFIIKNPSKIYICGLMMGGWNCQKRGDTILISKSKTFTTPFYLKGIPEFQSIDVMQLIMKKSLWLKYNGWYDKSKNSDGVMYERFCKENDYKFVKIKGKSLIIGEHW